MEGKLGWGYENVVRPASYAVQRKCWMKSRACQLLELLDEFMEKVIMCWAHLVSGRDFQFSTLRRS